MTNTAKITAKWIYPVSSPTIEDGVLIIENGKILKLGHRDEFLDIYIAHTIDLPHHIVMPGLINAHAHLELSNLKGNISNSLRFAGWIKEVVKYTKDANIEQFKDAVGAGLDELISHGVTTIADISISGSSLDLFRDKKIRGVVFHEIVGFEEKEAEDRIAQLKEKIETVYSTELISIGISPHSIYSVSPLLIKKAHNMAEKYKLPVAMHIAETCEEIDFTYGRDGDIKDLLFHLDKWDERWKAPECSPITYLDKLGALRGVLGIHCNYPETADIPLLKKYNISVVLCPLSNLWFKRRMRYPLINFLREDINVCLGTDSLASNNELNLFKEMREVKRLFPDLDSGKIIEMATKNGAYALSINNITGDISTGKDADIIAIDAKEVKNVSDIADYIIDGEHTIVLSMVKGLKVYSLSL